MGWLPQGLAKLEEIARNITEGRVAPAFSAIYTGAGCRTGPVGAIFRKRILQYRAFTEALRHVAVDLHFLGLSDPSNTKVPTSELNIVRQCAHWSDEPWVTHNVGDRIPLLDKDGAAALLTDEAKALSAKVTEFSERSERWANSPTWRASMKTEDRQSLSSILPNVLSAMAGEKTSERWRCSMPLSS